MQNRKKIRSIKYLSVALLVLLSMQAPLQVNSKTNDSNDPYGNFKANVGDTRTYVITNLKGSINGTEFPNINEMSAFNSKFKLETGIKFTVRVTHLINSTLDVFSTQPPPYISYNNITITKNDHTNVTAQAVQIEEGGGLSFIVDGFNNTSDVEKFIAFYNNKYPDFGNIFDYNTLLNSENNSEIVFYHSYEWSTYYVTENITYNWRTGWLDKYFLMAQIFQTGAGAVDQEITIEPYSGQQSRSSLNFMDMTVVLVLGIPALLVLERRKRNKRDIK